MNPDAFLSIGEFSKLTGVGINSLRYYDRIGILKPAYINPESQYRYYSFAQFELVYAIKLCVAYDVPLKNFTSIVNDDRYILYSELFQQAEAAIIQKQMSLQQSLSQIKSYQRSIRHAESCSTHSDPKEYFLRDKTCLIEPFSGAQLSDQMNKTVKEKLMKIHQYGWDFGNEYGLLLLKEHDAWVQYLFIDIAMPKNAEIQGERILRLPEGRYICQKQECSHIDRFKDWIPIYVKESDIECVIETPFLIGKYPYSNPPLELRCFLK